MSAPDVEALLFDLGGVVVAIDFDRVFASWAASAGVPVEAVRRRFAHDEAYRRHELGEITAADYFATLRASLGLDLDDEAFARGWSAVFVDEIAPTVALLPRLAARIPIDLFSNTNAAHCEVWRPRYAAALAPFRRQFASHEIGLRKPSRESFHHVARAMGVEPGRILFLDDTRENVAGARAAGLQAVHVREPADVERAVAPWLGAP